MLMDDYVSNIDIFTIWCKDWFLGSKITTNFYKEGKWFNSLSNNMHNGIVFSDPRFISAHLIPESDNPEDDKIYFFFRENAIDGEHTGKATHARIGQICKVKWWLLPVRLNVLVGCSVSDFRNCIFLPVNYSMLILALH